MCNKEYFAQHFKHDNLLNCTEAHSDSGVVAKHKYFVCEEMFQAFIPVERLIMRKTCPCNIYPLEPHFYTAKLRYVGVYLFVLFLLQNIKCGYSLEPPHRVLLQNIKCRYSLQPPRRGGSNV